MYDESQDINREIIEEMIKCALILFFFLNERPPTVASPFTIMELIFWVFASKRLRGNGCVGIYQVRGISIGISCNKCYHLIME